MALNEKILEDDNWETQTFHAALKGNSIHVLVDRKHKWEGCRIVSNVILNMSQAEELGKRLICLVHDHGSEA